MIQAPNLIEQQATTLKENERLRRDNDKVTAERDALRKGINEMKILMGIKVKEPL